MNDYNTQRERLILKEYGRNVQMLVNYLSTIEDKEERNQSAKALVDLMKQINPSIKEGNEDNQKLWDDLIIMSDFKIDVDGPFPKPLKELLYKKPERLGYKDKSIIYKHYGLNIQLLVDKAVRMDDPEEQEAAVIYVGRLMKSFSSFWNKENLDDETIVKNIRELSRGQLEIDLEKVKNNNLFEYLVKDKGRKSNHQQHQQQHKGGKRPRRKRN
jgi:ArsR family metal-binding transcriptional regulator